MNWLKDVLGFLARPWIWFSIMALILLYMGVVSGDDLKGWVGTMIEAVKDFDLPGGG